MQTRFTNWSVMHDHTFYLKRCARLWLLSWILFTVAGCRPSEAGAAKGPVPVKSSGGLHAVMETDKGIIEFELLEKDAPTAVENFRLLAERDYYKGVTFHRIIKGFMIQGGDPKGNGMGGESAWGNTFADEIDRNSPLYKGGYRRGMLAMANSGPNTNGSQFFIMHQDYPLRPNYTIFGRVTAGMEVVDALATTPTSAGDDGNKSRPVTPPVIKKITIRP
jgi:cyclophilin family peptidyl-prolyl cis-trans isomerase